VKRTLVAFLFGPEESGTRRIARRLIGAPQDGVIMGGRPGHPEGGSDMEAIYCSRCGASVTPGSTFCSRCGAAIAASAPPVTVSQGGLNMTAAVILVGGALVAIGSFLPWATATGLVSVSKSGLDGGDGIFTLPLGVVIALLGLSRLQRSGLPGNRLVMVILGIIAVGLAWFEGATIQGRLDAAASAYAVYSLGMGIYVMGVGGVLVVLVSIFGERGPQSIQATRAPAAAPVAMPSGVYPCYRCQAPVWPPMPSCGACGAPLSWQAPVS